MVVPFRRIIHSIKPQSTSFLLRQSIITLDEGSYNVDFPIISFNNTIRPWMANQWSCSDHFVNHLPWPWRKNTPCPDSPLNALFAQPFEMCSLQKITDAIPNWWKENREYRFIRVNTEYKLYRRAIMTNNRELQ